MKEREWLREKRRADFSSSPGKEKEEIVGCSSE